MALSQNLGDLFSGLEDQDSANNMADKLAKMGIAPEFAGIDYAAPSYSGDFDPLLYDDPIAAQYETIGHDPRVRQVQMDALQSLIDRGSGAADAKMQAASFGAMDEASQLARGREDAIRMDMQRKGQSGSGLDAVMRAQASQQAANRARAGTQQAVLDAALEKLAATQGAMAGADQMRGRDFQRDSANTGIINDFNVFNTKAKNAARQANVDVRNRAGMRNLDARQGINNATAGARNNSLDRRDRIVGATHDAKMDRFGMENAIEDRRRGGVGKAIAGGVGAASDVANAAMAGMGSGYGGSTKAATKPATYAGAGEKENPFDDDVVYG
jgi:hypothetical protein